MEQLLTSRELQSLLRITRYTVFKWAREKKMPCIRLGKEVRFSPSAIEAWLKSQSSDEIDTSWLSERTTNEISEKL
ncbi:MAG: helix-turn-helix domain-containing protein [Desulfomonilaceae bacterium]